jgi:hypothetical protein
MMRGVVSGQLPVYFFELPFKFTTAIVGQIGTAPGALPADSTVSSLQR